MRRLTRSSSPRRGSIIVLVLVFVVLLTFIVVAFLGEATSKIKYYGLFHNRDDLRTDAYSALEISLAIVNQYREIEGSLWGPEQGWSNPLEQFGFTPRNAQSVKVTFTDESSRIGLKEVDRDTLMALFEILGFDLPEREELTDGLIDWTDVGDERSLNGFDGEDYEDMDPPYRPANAPVTSWDEFRLIHPFRELFFTEDGTPEPEWAQFREAFSLYHSGPPNINQAPSIVLQILQEKGGLDMLSFLDYKNGQDGIPGTGDDRLLRSVDERFVVGESAAVATEIELLRVRVDARRGSAVFTVEALVSWSGSDAAAADTRSAEDQPPDAREEEDAQSDSARDNRRRARGNARTAPSEAAELGYPFRFLRLTENRKF